MMFSGLCSTATSCQRLLVVKNHFQVEELTPNLNGKCTNTDNGHFG